MTADCQHGRRPYACPECLYERATKAERKLAEMHSLAATELGQLVAMLERAGIGHGTRGDHNPPGTSVQVESGESDDGFVAEFGFDADGRLKEVTCYPVEAG